jgi:hypothetical protein
LGCSYKRIINQCIWFRRKPSPLGMCWSPLHDNGCLWRPITCCLSCICTTLWVLNVWYENILSNENQNYRGTINLPTDWAIKPSKMGWVLGLRHDLRSGYQWKHTALRLLNGLLVQSFIFKSWQVANFHSKHLKLFDLRVQNLAKIRGARTTNSNAIVNSEKNCVGLYRVRN